MQLRSDLELRNDLENTRKLTALVPMCSIFLDCLRPNIFKIVYVLLIGYVTNINLSTYTFGMVDLLYPFDVYSCGGSSENETVRRYTRHKI